MRILLATHSLEGIGGSETYVVTVADHLQRLGHDVWLYAHLHGRGSDLAQDLGVRVAVAVHELPVEPDVLVIQDGVVACEMAARYPLAPQVFVAHSDIFDLQLPPQLPGLTSAVVTLYDRVDRRIRALALEHEVVRLNQPVDVERFKPTRPLPEHARVAVLFGNYVHGERLALVRRSCERAGLELRHVGAHAGGFEPRPAPALNQADVVIGKARVIVEAMACGRAAYVFDHNGGEGWVTAESYAGLAADNFGGQSHPAVVDEDRLAGDLAAYDPGMGIANRDLAVAHHNATKHAAALVDVLLRVAPRRAPVDAPLHELARMVRLYHRADTSAFGLHAELERAWARVQELEGELQRVRAAGEYARVEFDRVREERDLALAEASGAQYAFAALRGTRRWRIVQALMRPLDWMRSSGRRAAR